VSVPQIPWNELSTTYPPDLVRAIRQLFDRGGPFETSAAELSAETPSSVEVAERMLTALSPPLIARTAEICTFCDTEGLANEQPRHCPNCDHDLEEPGSIKKKRLYIFNATRTRDVRWVLALHGMNTRGAWQEEFNWRIATAYGRSVPVAIYKYGLVRPGAISRWYLRKLILNISEKLVRLNGQTKDSGLGGPPDVIAHSLGTWLVGHALLRDSSLKIGRLVLTGSILRPDFKWLSLISNGQVQAVLNLYGTRDIWAAVAHYVIPDSGPSGRIGFVEDAPMLVQIRAEGFAHSDVFSNNNLPRVFENTWHPFLTVPQADLSALSNHKGTRWSQSLWPFRATLLPLILISIWWLLVFGGIFCLGVGIYRIFNIFIP
jgi:hypothetical protein